MKRSMIQCELCPNSFLNIPLLTCGHFICNVCYMQQKNINRRCNCPFCDKKLKRGKTYNR